MQRLTNFCKMRHPIRAHCHVLTSKLAWTYGQTRSLETAVEHRRPLLTLDPKNLSASRHWPRELSRKFDVSYTVQTRSSFVPGMTIRYTTENRRYIPFPENTRGFLYYKAPEPGHPDYSGSLRFRVISESGSNSFENGVDLKLPSGAVWEIHLYAALQTVRHGALVIKLVEEGLVSPSIIEKLRNMPPVLLHASSQIIYNLDDPFITRLHCTESLVVMTQDYIACGQLMPFFLDSRRFVYKHPYNGIARVCFERSTLPEHFNTRTVVLRIIDLLTPVECVLKDYDYYVKTPAAGELLSGSYHRMGKRAFRPWSMDLDKGKGKSRKMIAALWPKDPDEKDLKATT